MSKLVGFILLIFLVIGLFQSPFFWLVVSIIAAVFIVYLIIKHKKNKDDYLNITPNQSPSISYLENENNRRILSESSSIVNSTKDLSTFFSRYNLLVDKSHGNVTIINFPKALYECVDRIITDANLLTTAKGKENRLQKNIGILRNNVLNNSSYQNAINDQINRLEQEIKKVKNVPVESIKLTELQTTKVPSANLATTMNENSPVVAKSIDVVSDCGRNNEWYISISFNKSSSANFDKAVFLAKQANSYVETEFNGKIIYQAIYTSEPPSYLNFVMLYEVVGGWKSSFVIINDNLIDRKIIGGLNYCYGDMCRNGRSLFCFGASEYTDNPFGCHRLQISASNHPWWQFTHFDGYNYIVDKSAIKNRIDEYSTAFRCCPNFNYDRIIEVFNQIPQTLSEDEFNDLEMNRFFLGRNNNYLQ